MSRVILRSFASKAKDSAKKVARVKTPDSLLLELNGGDACKSYLIADMKKKKALILDPIKSKLSY